MNGNFNELIPLLKDVKSNSLLTWEFHPPYQGTVENLRKDVAQILPKGLAIGCTFECNTEEYDSKSIITKVTMQLVYSF